MLPYWSTNCSQACPRLLPDTPMVCDQWERKHDNDENSEENELCPKS